MQLNDENKTSIEFIDILLVLLLLLVLIRFTIYLLSFIFWKASLDLFFFFVVVSVAHREPEMFNVLFDNLQFWFIELMIVIFRL